MKPYDQLTKRGQLRRLRQVALNAMEHYDLRVKWLSFLALHTNPMFKVQTETDEKFVLRIYSEVESTLLDNEAEVFWLAAINRDTNLKVCEPVSRRDGKTITLATAPGVPGEKRCILFRWVFGRTLDNHLNPENYEKLGRTMAGLHNHATTLNPLPPDIRPKKWDTVFYYPEEPVVYNTPEYSSLFPPDRLGVLNRVISRADDEFQKLYAGSADQMIIHGDLHYWNVHVYRGELCVIDFEDVILGYPVQDIAVTLYYGRERESYDELKDAFQRGYTSLRPWPVGSQEQLETLMAARTVMFVNYVAWSDPSPLKFIVKKCEELRAFLRRLGG